MIETEALILQSGISVSQVMNGASMFSSRRIGMSDDEIRSAKVGPSMDSLSDKYCIT